MNTIISAFALKLTVSKERRHVGRMEGGKGSKGIICGDGGRRRGVGVGVVL